VTGKQPLFNQEISQQSEGLPRPRQLSFCKIATCVSEQRSKSVHLINDMISQQHQARNEAYAESLRLLPADKNKELENGVSAQ